eukprot:15823786-Heterocapsa_arctica.AAC.1
MCATWVVAPWSTTWRANGFQVSNPEVAGFSRVQTTWCRRQSRRSVTVRSAQAIPSWSTAPPTFPV